MKSQKKLELHSKQHEINPNMNFFAVVCMRLNSSWNLVDILLTDAERATRNRKLPKNCVHATLDGIDNENELLDVVFC